MTAGASADAGAAKCAMPHKGPDKESTEGADFLTLNERAVRQHVPPAPSTTGPAPLGSATKTLLAARGVAQPGSAPALGAGGRGFESRLPD